jgi:hypothetical protein
MKFYISINAVSPSGDVWIKNIINLTPLNDALYATRSAIERGADRLRGVADAALGFNKMCWGMG